MKKIVLKKTKSIMLLLLLLISGIVSAQDKTVLGGKEWTGTTEQKVWGLMAVWSQAKFNFPFFDKHPELNWDEKVIEYIPKVVTATNMDSYYNVLCEFAALLKDGHTAVNKPGGLFNPADDWPPVEVEVVNGKYFIARVGESRELNKINVYPGLEIIEIEGTAVDNYYQSTVLRYESRGTKQADEAINIYKLLSGPKDSKVRMKVREINGTERFVSLIRNSKTDSGGRFFNRLFNWYMAENPIEVRTVENGIIYIKIANFDSENVTTEFLKEFDKLNLPEVKGIILDLRFNPGGDDKNAFPIISCFLDSPVKSFRWKSPKYVPAKNSWGFAPEWEEGYIGNENIQPREGKRYSGPLVILIGHTTYSTAEDFLIPFDFSNRAVLTGAITAGSTGNPCRIQLPGGGNFRVVTLETLYPDGRKWVGIGIKPAVEVEPTQKDFVNGNDPVLLKGIEVIKNWKSYRKTK